MPRSIKAPQTGSLVWYYSAPTGVAPIPALVLSGVDAAHFNLFVFDGTLAAAGGIAIGKPVTNVLYTQQQTVASGAFCTYMRVNEFLAGTNPDLSPSNPGGSFAGGATPFAQQQPMGMAAAALAEEVAVSEEQPVASEPDVEPDDDDDDAPARSRTTTTTRTRTTTRHPTHR